MIYENTRKRLARKYDSIEKPVFNRIVNECNKVIEEKKVKRSIVAQQIEQNLISDEAFVDYVVANNVWPRVSELIEEITNIVLGRQLNFVRCRTRVLT